MLSVLLDLILRTRLLCNAWMNLSGFLQTGVRLLHLRLVCQGGGGLEEVRALELCYKNDPGHCCLAKAAPAKQKTDDRRGGWWGGLNGWLVFVLLFCVCVYP